METCLNLHATVLGCFACLLWQESSACICIRPFESSVQNVDY